MTPSGSYAWDEEKMGNFGEFGFVVLIIFIVIRLLIAVGLLYCVTLFM